MRVRSRLRHVQLLAHHAAADDHVGEREWMQHERPEPVRAERKGGAQVAGQRPRRERGDHQQAAGDGDPLEVADLPGIVGQRRRVTL